MAKINDLPLLPNPTEDMYCLVGKDNLKKVPWSAIMGQIGAPYVATAVSQMTDKTRVYVYYGEESGYIKGNWYYWDANTSAWTSGDKYNSAAVDTDKTLTQSDKPADSAVVGKEIGSLKESLGEIEKSCFDVTEVSEHKKLEGLEENGYWINKNLNKESSTNAKNITFSDVIEGKTYRCTTVNGGNCPAIIWLDSNKKIVSYNYSQSQFVYESCDVIAPKNSISCIVNTLNANLGETKLEMINSKKTYTPKLEKRVIRLEEEIYKITDIEQRLIDEQLKNDFKWKSFSGTRYATFTFDDALGDIDMIEDLFEKKGVPCCFAVIPSNLDNMCTNGEKVREVLNRAVNHGGEILSHWGPPLKSSSSEADYYNVYVKSKEILIESGYDVNGIIVAGGTGYETQDFQKGISLARIHYNYADLVSKNETTVEQFYNYRKFCDNGYDDIKQYVDLYLNGDTQGRSKWMNFASHGTKDTSIDVFEQIIDYLLSQNIQIVTWKEIYDKFKSSKLEEQIKSLKTN